MTVFHCASCGAAIQYNKSISVFEVLIIFTLRMNFSKDTFCTKGCFIYLMSLHNDKQVTPCRSYVSFSTHQTHINIMYITLQT